MTSNQTCRQCGEQSTGLVEGLCAKCQSLHTATVAPTPVGGLDETLAPSVTDLSGDAVSGDFGEYELIQEIARGGMGVIYKARHRKLNRIAALKMILGGRFSTAEELQRFHVEAEAAARLDHPGIVPVYEIGECEGQAFFAMKFVDGGSLADQIDRFRQQPRTAVELLAKVARAVHHAHQRGILHRDLKPANILIDENDQPLVTDLGLAKKTAGGSDLTNTGAVLGTPSYMPPEQATGNAVVTTAADVYSLGAIMYELLTGQPPYKGANAVETVMQVIQNPPDAPHKKNAQVDRDLELICLKCLQREPEARYGSALELANDLEAWLQGDAISIRQPSLVAHAARWFRQNQKLVYGAFALLTGLLLTLPFVLAFLGEDSDVGDVYKHFSDQRPWLFSFGTVPSAVSGFAISFLLLVLWPSVGLLNAMLTRPTSMRRALGAGVLTAMLLSVVIFLLLGWMVVLQGSVIATNGPIRVLASAVWQVDEAQREKALKAANELFGGVEGIPQSDRAAIVADRISSDHFASAPFSIALLLVAGFVFSVPVIYGTIFGHVLTQRANRFWVCAIRYALAWWSTTLSVLLFLALTGLIKPNVDGQSASDFRVTSSVIALAGIAVAYLALRRWKRTIPRVGKEPSTAPA